MSNKEQYKKAFSVLQTSADFSFQEKQLNIIRRKTVARTILSAAAVLLLIIFIGGGTAYATNIGDIQTKFDVWIHGRKGSACLQDEGDGYVSVEYVDANGNRQAISQIAYVDHEGPLSAEEKLELMDSIYNEVNVEFSPFGRVTLFFQDQVIDITDKFVDGTCELYVKGQNGYEASVSVDYESQDVSIYEEHPDEYEAEVASRYTYSAKFNMWDHGKSYPATAYYNADGEFEVIYRDEEGRLKGPGGGNFELENLLARVGADTELTQEELVGVFSNEVFVEFENDGKVMVYYQDQIIDVTDKFVDGICNIHVIGRLHGWEVNIDLKAKDWDYSYDMYDEEAPSDEVMATIEHRPFPSYNDEELLIGSIRIDEKGRIKLKKASYGDNGKIKFENNETKTALADDVFIFYYPEREYYGETINREGFLDYLKTQYLVDCYYHLNKNGKIDYIRGAYKP